MIQRVQTVYLLLVCLISVLLFFFPVFDVQTMAADGGHAHTPVSFYINTNAFLLILNSAIGILAFFAIWLFKKRMMQIRACNLIMILTCVLIGLLFYTADTLSSGASEKAHYLFGIYLPLIQLAFAFLALRGIKKDEELVRSANRLR
jgi:peptidoglycan/LPS O-acetylase OafA/YrhL